MIVDNFCFLVDFSRWNISSQMTRSLPVFFKRGERERSLINFYSVANATLISNKVVFVDKNFEEKSLLQNKIKFPNFLIMILS